jgi:hypothetical protein
VTLSAPLDILESFTTVTHLRNGKGVLLEAKNADTIRWIRREENRDRFASTLEEGSCIKERTYAVLVPFVPLSLRPEEEADLREIEEQNSLEEKDIISARWVKPPRRRSPNQLVAHLILTISSPDVANQVIRDGMNICQKKVHPKKLKKEPLRCLKCQGYGHMATKCVIPMDICGTCSREHKTADCNSYKSERCASCQEDGHTSWSRNCPTFVRKCKELDDRTPENSMPYFPTSLEWTQVNEPTTRAPPPPPPPRPPYVSGANLTPALKPAMKMKGKMHSFATPTTGLRQTKLRFADQMKTNQQDEPGPSGTQRENTPTPNGTVSSMQDEELEYVDVPDAPGDPTEIQEEETVLASLETTDGHQNMEPNSRQEGKETEKKESLSDELSYENFWKGTSKGIKWSDEMERVASE